MEKQKKNKTVRKPYEMTPEAWALLESELKITGENFTVHIDRLLREKREREKKGIL